MGMMHGRTWEDEEGALLTPHRARTPNLFSFRRQTARARAILLSGGAAAGKVGSMDCGNRPLNLTPPPFEGLTPLRVGQRRKTAAAVKVASPFLLFLLLLHGRVETNASEYSLRGDRLGVSPCITRAKPILICNYQSQQSQTVTLYIAAGNNG